MRVFMLIAGSAIGLGGLSIEAQANCNARGEWCNYPTWAANAFSGPTGRKYLPAYRYGRADDYEPTYGYGPAYGYVAPGYGYGARRYRWREGR